MATPGFFVPVQMTPESKVPRIVNCTPHSIRFQDNDGNVVTVQPSGYTLKATPQEKVLGHQSGCEFVTTKFVPSEEGAKEVQEIVDRKLLPVGSIISAQTWPGLVVSLVPVEGYERKPPAEKLYRCDKFNIFGEKKSKHNLSKCDEKLLWKMLQESWSDKELTKEIEQELGHRTGHKVDAVKYITL